MKIINIFVLIILGVNLITGNWACVDPSKNHRITLDSLNNILLVSADAFATIQSSELTDLDEVGFCWNESRNPTIQDNIFSLGSPFSTKISTTIRGLTADKPYFVRAFVQGEDFVVYSDEQRITTWNGKLQDVEGYIYKGVQIGNQGWMAENLRTTKYADGSPININNASNRTYWYGSEYHYVPNFDTDINRNGSLDTQDSLLYVQEFGLLYSWYAANNFYDPEKDASLKDRKVRPALRDVCPAGWHLPSFNEWQELRNFLEATHKTGDIAGFLTSKTGWADNLNGSDIYGFGLLPNGYWHEPTASHTNILGRSAFLWFSNEVNDANAQYLQGSALDKRFVTGAVGKAIHGFCIRCLKDK